MAYQTLPNTFVSGGTIYSTAVSANMVALLQGYTTGNYDLWGHSVAASGGVTVGTVASMSSSGSAFSQSLYVANTAAVGGAASVAGSMTVGGDLYTTAWQTWTVTPSRISVSAATGYYKTVGNMVFCRVGIFGACNTDGHIGFKLPVTASASYPTYGKPQVAFITSAGVAQETPATVEFTPGTNDAVVYKSYGSTTFTSGVTYTLGSDFWYERA